MPAFRSIFCAAAIFMTVSPLPLLSQLTGDALFVNGRIHTLDAAGSIASAMAVRGGRILATGADAELRARYAGFPVIDIGHRNLFPGFTDAHGHLHGLGEETLILLLHGAASKQAANIISPAAPLKQSQ